MNAQRAVKAAKASGDPDQMKAARASVQAAKVALVSVGRLGGRMTRRT